MERRLLVSKHSWRLEKGFDGSKYKRNVVLCSYLRWKITWLSGQEDTRFINIRRICQLILYSTKWNFISEKWSLYYLKISLSEQFCLSICSDNGGPVVLSKRHKFLAYVTALSIRIGKGKSHKRWFLRGRIFKRRECLIIIFLFVRKLSKPGHGSTFHVTSGRLVAGERRLEKFKAQVGRRGMQMNVFRPKQGGPRAWPSPRRQLPLFFYLFR